MTGASTVSPELSQRFAARHFVTVAFGCPAPPEGMATLAAALLAGSLVLSTGASAVESRDEQGVTILELVNHERAANGVGALVTSADLESTARHHSAEMAEENRLQHNPSLAQEVAVRSGLAENVGYAQSAEQAHAAFMASAPHRSSILSGHYTEVGIGTVESDGLIWVTEVFRDSGAARPSTARGGSPGPPERPVPTTRSRPILQPVPSTGPRPRVSPSTTRASVPDGVVILKDPISFSVVADSVPIRVDGEGALTAVLARSTLQAGLGRAAPPIDIRVLALSGLALLVAGGALEGRHMRAPLGEKPASGLRAT